VTPETWFLYVVRCSDGTLYAGVTTDIERRVREHNAGARGARYTRSRRPVALVYSLAVNGDRGAAQKAEHAFRKLTREQKVRLITARVGMVGLTFGRVRVYSLDKRGELSSPFW